MKSDPPVATQKRPFSIVRLLALLAVLAIFPVLYLADKHQTLVEVCNLDPGEPQDTLAACDTLLTWTAWTPETRSLMHRHKMRVFIKQEDWDAAVREVDLAIAEDPQSPVPWQWKSMILARAEDYRASLGAIDEALKLDPEDEYSLENKYKLLSELEEYGAIDDMFSQKWNSDKSTDWLPDGELQEITWHPSRFPKSQAVFLEYTLKLRDDLAGDLHDPKLRWNFILHCRLLAGNCPPLLPEKRASYPNPGCDKVVEDFERQHPKLVKNKIGKHGYQTLHDLVKMERLNATQIFQASYVATLVHFEHNPSPEVSGQLIVSHRMFECLSGGEFIIPTYAYRGSEQVKRASETLFNTTLRENLIDLAYVYSN